MNFTTKINAKRPFNNKGHVKTALESDRGRIINSAGLRRLQQKTQVFPLERNAAVRSRLTHSLEVQQNGRFIVQTIFKELSEQHQIDYGLKELERELESLVEMACLMHDIGNPAFGHFGEAAINQWFKEYLSTHPEFCDALAWQSQLAHPLNDTQALLHELHHYEGNAQAIRNINSLFALNLTYCQAASILKYTRCGTLPKAQIPQDKSYLMKKVGFYYSEKNYVDQLYISLDISPGCRHPASYIMEAADDIAYCLADIEDAVEKGLIDIHQLICALKAEYTHIIEEFNITDEKARSFMHAKCEAAYEQAQKDLDNVVNGFFIWLRVHLLHPLIKHSAKRFCDNIEGIYRGNFNSPLIEDNSFNHAITKTLKRVAFKHVFSHQEVEQLELQGYKIISTLLNEFSCLLNMSSKAFSQLLNGELGYAVESRLLNKISNKYIAVYKRSISDLTEEQQSLAIYEFYYRCRLIQDFIGNMTDQYAYDTYKTLMVIE